MVGNMMALSKKRKYFVGTLVLVLIISVAFNLYACLAILPKMQATTNDMRVEAFGSWLRDMSSAAYTLETIETKEDLEQAVYFLDSAMWSRSVLSIGTDKDYPTQYTKGNLYYWMDKATGSLYDAVFQIWSSYVLDEYVRLRIENITQAIRNMRTTAGIEERLSGYEHSEHIGVDLVQRLRDEGKLTDLVNYCIQIQENSSEIFVYLTIYWHPPPP